MQSERARETVTFTATKKGGMKKIKISARVSRTPYNAAVDDQKSKEPIFESIGDFYDTGAKLLMLFGKGNFANVKKWVESQ